MSPHLSVFYSNRVEELYQRLKQQLFNFPADSFTRRLVVVPSPPMKTWLMLQLAKDPEVGIAAGLQVSYPDETIAKSLLESESEVLTNASRMEMALTIENQLRLVAKTWPELSLREREIWTPLLKYLHVPFLEFSELSRKGERRLIALSSQLASLFFEYSHYGRAMVAEWEQKANRGWQQELWQRVCGDIPAISLRKMANVHLHLFSISHLSPCHLDCFAEAARVMPTNFYLLSPCLAFWSDIRTDRESRRLHAFWKAKGVSERQLEALDDFLRDCNPLLANFGRLGREMVQQLEEREAFSDEKYVLPASVFEHSAFEHLIHDVSPAEDGPLSLLGAVQADLLLMRSPAPQDKVPFNSSEDSIQVHIAETRLRETEVVYDILQHLIARQVHARDPLRPEEILVMAPDIMEYAPFIKMVFQREKELDYHIMEAEAPCDYPLVQGFLSLLKLANSRWTTKEVMELFSCPAFRNRQRFSEEQVQKIQDWIRKSGVCWGQSSAHRDEVLKNQHCQSGMVDKSHAGTWESGLESLLVSLITTPGGDESILIESTQAELLGKFVELMRSMRDDLKILERGTMLTLQDWRAYLQALFEAYFEEDADTGSQNLLFKPLDALDAAGQKMPDDRFPFATIFHHLEESLQRQRTSYRETHLHAVRFCPLLPMRTVPAKVIVLMGMQEGAFPRATPAHSLNLLNSHPKADYCPTPTDFDRYLFLEALLSARQHLILTYQGSSQKDNREQSASLVVQELMAYLDRAYAIDGRPPSSCLTTHHPFHAFDKRNFDGRSYSPFNFRLAKAYYQIDKTPPFFFISHFGGGRAPENLGDLRLDLRDLSAFAKNPLKSYFNKTLGLYIPKEEEWEVDEKFVFNNLDLYQVRKWALRSDFAEVLQKLELPLGLFKEVALKTAETTISKTRDMLSQAGVQEIFCIELTDRIDHPNRVSADHWQLPPLQVRCGNNRTVTLVGKLEDVSAQGLIANYEKEFDRAVQLLPQFLVYEMLAEKRELPLERQLIFAQSGKALPTFIDNPQKRLSRYLDYYLQGLTMPSPLLPKWIDPVLQVDSLGLKKKIDSLNNSFSKEYNQELLWLMRSSNGIDTDSILRHWKPIAQELFSDLQRHWFKK